MEKKYTYLILHEGKTFGALKYLFLNVFIVT